MFFGPRLTEVILKRLHPFKYPEFTAMSSFIHNCPQCLVEGKDGELSSQASKMLYKPSGAVYIASYKEPLEQSDCWKLFVQL